MKIVLVILAMLFGALALLAFFRFVERALGGSLTGPAVVQLLLGVVFGFLAWKAFSKVRAARV